MVDENLCCSFFIIKKLRKVCSEAEQPYKLFKQNLAGITLLFQHQAL